MVTCKLTGGIGNQMFQIAATVGLAEMNNDEAVFNKWYCSCTKKDMYPFFSSEIKLENT